MTIRILAIGASETNRRRPPSRGVEANQMWARELERRYTVLGYWPTFLMHGIEAQACGVSPSSLDVLHGFGRGRYLYDRRYMYQWGRHAELWNVAIPANNARSGLYYLNEHRERFRDFAPDVIVLCLGSMDCLGCSITLSAADLTEIGDIAGLNHDTSLTFEYCYRPKEFHALLTCIADLVAWIAGDASIVHLDIIGVRHQSRGYRDRVRAFSDVVRNVSQAFGHSFITYPFLENCPDAQKGHWLQDDGHPTDAMNAKIAGQILDSISGYPLPNYGGRKSPTKIIEVADWLEESSLCS